MSVVMFNMSTTKVMNGEGTSGEGGRMVFPENSVSAAIA
jgi:hypothetical protein